MSTICMQARRDQGEQLAAFQQAFFPRDELLTQTADGWQMTLDDLRAEYLHEQLSRLATRPGFASFERWQQRQQEERRFLERQNNLFDFEDGS